MNYSKFSSSFIGFAIVAGCSIFFLNLLNDSNDLAVSPEIKTLKNRLKRRVEMIQEDGAPFSDNIPDKSLVHEMVTLSKLVYRVNETHPNLNEILPEGYVGDNDHYVNIGSTEAMVSRTDYAEKNRVAVTFRGTQNVDDWADNVKIALVRWELEGIPDNVRVHRGFRNALMDVVDKLENFVLQIMSNSTLDHQDELYVCGHSLGGALAQLFGPYMAHKYPSLRVRTFTYGQPRIGNRQFKSWIETEFTNLQQWRFVNKNDLVPRRPWRPMGYAHTGHHVQFEPDSVKAYYRHSGDKDAGLSSIPRLWNYYAFSVQDHKIFDSYAPIVESIFSGNLTYFDRFVGDDDDDDDDDDDTWPPFVL